jgi:DnaJ-domain-containing protein 1
MDRQRNAETTKRLDDKILQKALGVITQSYQGIPPEKLFNEAIHCFDALIDISLQTENIRDFAQRKHLDNKYIVDGANFVISKMHFNTGNNHYITLGLPSTASAEMIRERWKRLMLLYHPDRQPGAEEWVSERAKKVNEAYNTLKDEEKRNVYDRELSEPSPDMNFSSHPKVRRQVSRRDSHILPLSPGWIKIRSYLPKALVGVYIIVALVFIWFIYMQNRSSHLETALLNDKTQSAERISRQ